MDLFQGIQTLLIAQAAVNPHREPFIWIVDKCHRRIVIRKFYMGDVELAGTFRRLADRI